MPSVRPISVSDLRAVEALDASYTSEMVWQVEMRRQSEEMSVSFRQVRLPRPVRAAPPLSGAAAIEKWQEADLFLVATEEGQVVGYLRGDFQGRRGLGLVEVIAVAPEWRRRGLGRLLLQEAVGTFRRWRLRWAVAETQTQNQPANAFLEQMGFGFCGFNERAYLGGDIALLFAQELSV